MKLKTLMEADDLIRYVTEEASQESDVLKELREETDKLPLYVMQIPPDQGALISFLIKLIGARKALEIGVFTGYSSICIASALPEDGQLIACDISDEWTSIALRYWKKAGIEHKIDLRLAPALETADQLIADGQEGAFDFVFIDADKESNELYYEAALKLLRPGGLIMIDNTLPMTLPSMKISNTKPPEDFEENIKKVNEKILSDDRTDAVLVTVSLGIMLARKC